MNKWDNRFLELAKFVSQWSRDPSTKVGAVIVDKMNRIVSLGYNGFACGVDDNKERLNNREIKYKMVVHADANAILFAKRDLTDCIMYLYPFMACSNCASLIIQSGIKKVVAPKDMPDRWKKDIDLALEMFREAKVEVVLV